jgi:hypothetical protein
LEIFVILVKQKLWFLFSNSTIWPQHSNHHTLQLSRQSLRAQVPA